MTITYNTADVVLSQMVGASFFMVCLVGIILISALILMRKRKTKQYRIELADMYIAGRIKQIASEDKVNLDEEYENFKRWDKQKRMLSSDFKYDDIVEEELKEKVSESLNKKKGAK